MISQLSLFTWDLVSKVGRCSENKEEYDGGRVSTFLFHSKVISLFILRISEGWKDLFAS